MKEAKSKLTAYLLPHKPENRLVSAVELRTI